MQPQKHYLPIEFHGKSGGGVTHVTVVIGGVVLAGVVAVLHVAVHHHAPLLPVPEVVVLQDVVELDGEVAPLKGRVEVQVHRVDIGKGNQLQAGNIFLKLEQLTFGM